MNPPNHCHNHQQFNLHNLLNAHSRLVDTKCFVANSFHMKQPQKDGQRLRGKLFRLPQPLALACTACTVAKMLESTMEAHVPQIPKSLQVLVGEIGSENDSSLHAK